MSEDTLLYIESGGDVTTLIPDWYDDDYDDEWDDEELDKPVHRKLNTMVFIDAESVSASSCSRIIGQANSIGDIAEIRYYARQKDNSTAAWKDVARQYGIKPILMYGDPAKDKIDNKIKKDIRSVLQTNKSIDIFCIASRDGGYTDLVNELRNLRKRVVILATKDTSKRLKQSASEVRGI